MASSRGPEAKDPKGLYATLDVPVTADAAELKKAYRRLALRWHPDKNPDDPNATAHFQKISSAYEVLTDPKRRQMYDSTGCVDADELADSGDMDHAADIFASFFMGGFGGMDDDLDADEQELLDEFLRMTGGAAFRPGGRRRKKGRGGRGKASKSSRMEEQMLGEFMSAMVGGGPSMPSTDPSCPKGHVLKGRKADAEFECDVCSVEIPKGKRLFDCKKCDYSLCKKCHAESAETLAEEPVDADMDMELLEAFCEMHTTPKRQGGRLIIHCKLCGKDFNSLEEVAQHMAEEHQGEFEAFVEEAMSGFEDMGMGGMGMGMPGMGGVGGIPMFMGMPGMGGMGMPGPGGMGGRDDPALEALFMAALEEEMGGGKPKKGRSKKKR